MSVLQQLMSPLASGGAAEPPRNKVTVVGVGQVGMACAISILLRVSTTVPPLLRCTSTTAEPQYNCGTIKAELQVQHHSRITSALK